MPETGLLTIFDCPKATLSIFSHLSFGLSILSMFFPNKIFLFIKRKFLLNKKIELVKRIAKRILDKYATSIDYFQVYMVSPFSQKLKD